MSMNSLLEKNIISEMTCGTNFSYILSENGTFLPTEYKVLQSQNDGSFVKCMKMLFNGKVQLYYFTNTFKALSSLLPNLDADRFIMIINNLFADIINVQNNGFLTCRNIDASFEKIFVDPTTYKVSLIYLPLNQHLFDDESSFENELRTSLVKLISSISPLSSPKAIQLSTDLQNGSLSIEKIYSKLSGKSISTSNSNRKEPAPNTFASAGMKLVAMNAPSRLEIVVNKNEFMIGKKDTNDGVVSFNKMISRVHCKITVHGNKYCITDLQSANGTFVNHTRLQPNQPTPLKNGDLVKLANSDFQVVFN